MKNVLLISLLTLFLIFGIGCASAADLDSNNGNMGIQEITLGSGLGGGDYTPFYAVEVCGSGLGGGDYTPFYLSGGDERPHLDFCNSNFGHSSGLGGNGFNPDQWNDFPDVSLYGPTPENHNLQ
ncbi:hypothetical protein [Methanobrevibacter sp.]|uniref:hypothetical protein n=1 Tax=Methanobrevibacter sp. TaxID=66852 RepID=UPI00386A8E28